MTRNIYRPAIWLLALMLTACGDSSEQLEPEAPDGAAPSYEQLNPPVPEPDDFSTAPVVPDQSQQDETVPLPGPGGEEIVPQDGQTTPGSDGITPP